MGRWAGRLAAVVVGTAATLAFATAAYAHVEVSAEPAVAGATNAVVTFNAEAESATAGIASVRVVLAQGIAPADVTLKTAPTGWMLTASTDGYTVGGKALPKGTDAVHSVTVARLPDAPRLVFKVLVNYSDGGVDRWIEEPTTANPSPASPAPVLQLRPAPRPAATPTTSAPTPSPAVSTDVTSAPASASPPEDSDGTSWVWWLIGAVLVMAVVTAAVVTIRRRTGESGATG